MLCRTSAVIPLKSRSRRSNRDKHCACKASTLLSSGAAAAAFSIFGDEPPTDKVTGPVEAGADASSPRRRNPFAPVRRADPADPARVSCAATKCFGFDTPCPFVSPVEWTWMLRDHMTAGVVGARKWVRGASLSDSPGALSMHGSVASAAAIGAVMPPAVAWCAAVSLFSLGAIDKFVDIRVNEALARAAHHATIASPASVASAASSAVSSESTTVASRFASLLTTAPRLTFRQEAAAPTPSLTSARQESSSSAAESSSSSDDDFATILAADAAVASLGFAAGTAAARYLYAFSGGMLPRLASLQTAALNSSRTAAPMMA